MLHRQVVFPDQDGWIDVQGLPDLFFRKAAPEFDDYLRVQPRLFLAVIYFKVWISQRIAIDEWVG